VSSQYLVMTQSAVVASDQTATISISPPVNQYWAVSTVRVSASTQPQFTFSKMYPYCALYHGATSLGGNATTFLDDTTLGSGDTSTIISGAITMYGDSITVEWMQATVGDTVTLTIYGRVYDNLPELQDQPPPVPGARFAGTTANASVWTYKSVVDNSVNPLTSVNFPLITIPDIQAEIISFKYRVITSAVAGSRSVGVRWTFPDNSDVARIYAPGVQNASGTVDYTFAQGIAAVNDVQPFQTAPIPTRLIIPSQSQVFASVLNIGAGDQWTLFSCTYRQYTSFTNVSYS
jgi:hypothetical protein